MNRTVSNEGKDRLAARRAPLAKKTDAESTLRVCNVGYLNASPYRRLRTVPGVAYREASPVECTRMLLEDEVDLALLPIAELLQHGGLTILPFGIAADGPVTSVLLFSNGALETVQRIWVDGASYTSVALLRVLLTKLLPEQGRTIRLDRTALEAGAPNLAAGEALLAIGDACLKLRGRYSREWDLSELWKQKTGLPFLFAAWAHKPRKLSEDQVEIISKACQEGVEQRIFFARDFADQAELDRSTAEHYVGNVIQYPLHDLILTGARAFSRAGAQIGLFPSTDETGGIRLSSSGNAGPQPSNGRPSELDAILTRASEGGRLSLAEGLLLAEHASLFELGLAADARREAVHPEHSVSYIIDRNINYTNVCNVYCRFCAFYRPPELPGRPSKKSAGGYVLTKEELGRKIEETERAGGIQILLQGGLNPDLGIEYYEDLFRWVKQNYHVNLHALSADEILHIAKVSHLTLDEVFDRLIAAGLGSLPGAGAELLVDRVRQRIARLKSPAIEWLDVHRIAHRKGLISTCTMLFGVQETWEDRLIHMLKLRQLQDETSGFTAFITWPFQDENTQLKRGDTSSLEYLRVQSIARLFLDNIPNVQSSWVTMGPSLGQVALSFGANDFGSVMFEENVVSAAGTTYCMDSKLIERHIAEAGFAPWRRNVHYEDVSPASGA